MRKPIKILLFCACCLVFIGCDRVTKDLAKEHLKDKESRTYFHDTFRLQYVENTGAALSLGDNLPKTASFWLLSMLPLLFLSGLAVYTIKNIRQMGVMKIFSLAMIFSGGIGNIRTGIFNVADIRVTAGVIGLFIFFNDKRKKETESVPVQ